MGISIRSQTAISTGREYGHTRPVSSSTLRADATKGDGMVKFVEMREVDATEYEPGYWEAEILNPTNVIEYRENGWPSRVYADTRAELVAILRDEYGIETR